MTPNQKVTKAGVVNHFLIGLRDNTITPEEVLVSLSPELRDDIGVPLSEILRKDLGDYLIGSLETAEARYTRIPQLGNVETETLFAISPYDESTTTTSIEYSSPTISSVPEETSISINSTDLEMGNYEVPREKLQSHVAELEKLATTLNSPAAKEAQGFPTRESIEEAVRTWRDIEGVHHTLEELEASGVFLSDAKLQEFLGSRKVPKQLQQAIRQEMAARRIQAEILNEANHDGAPRIAETYTDDLFLHPQKNKKISHEDLKTIAQQAAIEAEIRSLPPEQKRVVQEKAEKYLSSEWYRQRSKEYGASLAKQTGNLSNEAGSLLFIQGRMTKIAEQFEQKTTHASETIIQSSLFRDIADTIERSGGQPSAGTARGLGDPIRDVFSSITTSPADADIRATIIEHGGFTDFAIKAYSRSQEVVGLYNTAKDASLVAQYLAGAVPSTAIKSAGVGIGAIGKTGLTAALGGATVASAGTLLPAAAVSMATTWAMSQAQGVVATVSNFLLPTQNTQKEYQFFTWSNAFPYLILLPLLLIAIPLPGITELLGQLFSGNHFYNQYRQTALINGLLGGSVPGASTNPQDQYVTITKTPSISNVENTGNKQIKYTVTISTKMAPLEGVTYSDSVSVFTEEKQPTSPPKAEISIPPTLSPGSTTTVSYVIDYSEYTNASIMNSFELSFTAGGKQLTAPISAFVSIGTPPSVACITPGGAGQPTGSAACGSGGGGGGGGFTTNNWGSDWVSVQGALAQIASTKNSSFINRVCATSGNLQFFRISRSVNWWGCAEPNRVYLYNGAFSGGLLTFLIAHELGHQIGGSEYFAAFKQNYRNGQYCGENPTTYAKTYSGDTQISEDFAESIGIFFQDHNGDRATHPKHLRFGTAVVNGEVLSGCP